MKLLKFMLLALCMGSLVACSEEEDNNINPQSGLAGEWKASDISYAGKSSTEYQGYTSTVDFTGTGTDINLKTKFSEGPNAYTSSGSYNVMLKTTVNEMTTESEYPNPPFLLSGAWEKKGNTLIITQSGDEVQEATILELSDKSLKLQWDFADVSNNSGATSTVTVKGTYTFTRE